MTHAIAYLNRATHNGFGFGVIWLILAAGVLLGGVGIGLNMHPVQTITVTRQVAPVSGAALVSAWGTPDQSVDGASLSKSLAGTTCAVYRARLSIVCYVPR